MNLYVIYHINSLRFSGMRSILIKQFYILISLLFLIILGCNKNNPTSPVDENINLALPILISPTNVSWNNSSSVVLTWHKIANTSVYSVQVFNNNIFSTLLYKQNLPDTVLQIKGLNISTTYFWRVKAYADNDSSAWSALWSFYTGPQTPKLNSPVNNANIESLSPTFSWVPDSTAVSYLLQISTNNSFSTFIFNQSGLTKTSQPVTGLIDSTRYYWRVSTTNSFGTSAWSDYWNFFVVVPFICGSDSISYFGKYYHSIKISTQCWLKENLDVGSIINANLEQTSNSTIEKYCYNNNPNFCTAYGGLYQWAEAVQYKNGATNTSRPSPEFSGNVQGICPTGWHLPTTNEFLIFQNTYGGNDLKEIGQGSGYGAGTNTSGFSALLSGYDSLGVFTGNGTGTYFWCSTGIWGGESNYWALYGYDNTFIGGNIYTKWGLSIRCLKN